MIAAHYSDGRSARRHAVTLFRADDSLRVVGAAIDARYRLAALRATEPFDDAAVIVYCGDGAQCDVAGADYPALAAMLDRRPSLVVRAQRRWPVALGGVAILAAVIGVGAVWGLPAAAGAVTGLLPRAADLHIGALSRDAFDAQGLTLPSTLTAAQQAGIRQAWTSVQPVHPRLPLTLLLRAMPASFGPNALALPDGTVILNDAMARKILGGAARFDANQSAALAGVLAHEIGHVEGRHSMRAVVRASLTTAAAAYLFGDFSAVAAGAPAVLLGARYSRAMETEADRYAIAALQARHLPLAPLADLFQRLDKQDDHASGWLHARAGYLASHPDSAERSARLRAADHTR